jgi:GNAT superfamily N-acetyltransferase
MSAYRFCRSDDIGLLVDALNRCWLPHFPDEEPVTVAAFKRSIRDLQVWCSSCMVAFSGAEAIGVLIGAKRPSGTLVHKIAVHPDHRRQGHGRHLLASLGSKLAILGPPRIVAEVPQTLSAACALFSACGYVEETVLRDYSLDKPEGSERADAAPDSGLLIPVTVDDLVANGLLGEAPPPPSASARQVDWQTCWARSGETLAARKDDIAGFAIASDERLEAYVLYIDGEVKGRTSEAGAGIGAHARESEIVSLRSLVDDGGARFRQLFAHLRARGLEKLRFPKVHPAEISSGCLQRLGFSAAGSHVVYAARARAA